MYTSHVSFIILLYLSLLLYALPRAKGDITWENTKKPDGNFVGNAAYIPGAIQLTSKSDQLGSVWWEAQQQIINGFQAIIDFDVELYNSPAEQIAFVIQANSLNAISFSDDYWGFGFQNNFAVLFGANMASLYYTNPNYINFGFNPSKQLFSDTQFTGGHRQINITYSDGVLYVSLDDNRVSQTLQISNYVNMQNGMAWVGFTGASGGKMHSKGYKQVNVSGFAFTTLQNTMSVNLILLGVQYIDTSALISLNWTFTPPSQNSLLEVSVDSQTFKTLTTGENLNNFTFITDLIPRTYYFRVSPWFAGAKTLNYSSVLPVSIYGCMDGICDDGENATSCPSDCGVNLPCQNDCGKNGLCSDGTCICNPPFAGPTCSATTLKFNTTVDRKNASLGIGIENTNFNVQFLRISEIDFSTKKTIREYSLIPPNNQPTIFSDSNSFTFVYSFGNGATLNVSYNSYPSGKKIIFAKQQISIPPNALKLTVYIENWNFTNFRNTLHLNLQICKWNPSSKSVTCGGATFADTYWEQKENNFTFYVKYAQNGIVDGYAWPMTTIYDSTSQTTTLVIPYFLDYAILDPDFAVLTNSNPAHSTSKVTMGILIGGIVGGIVFTIILALVVYVIVARVKLQKAKLRMQGESLSSSSNISLHSVH